MTDHNAPIRKHKHAAKDHLAEVATAAVEAQELAAKHIARTHDPEPDRGDDDRG